MMPMQCPKCSSRNHRAPITNSQFEDQTVRKRKCVDCGEVWFTVELKVPSYAVGWSAGHQSKPVLRVPLELTASHVEPMDSREALAKANRERSERANATERNDPADCTGYGVN